MITIQEVHKYLNLVEIGMAKPILCPLDNQHTHMVSWIDEEDVVVNADDDSSDDDIVDETVKGNA